MMFIESVPVCAPTVIVTRPVTLDGSFALMAFDFQDVIVSACPFAVTLQPLHCEPSTAPDIVMVLPAAIRRAAVFATPGPMEIIVAAILHRAAAKYPIAAVTFPQLTLPSEVLLT